MQKAVRATLVASSYLLLYHLLFTSHASPDLLTAMFLFSPFVVGWMAITILKDKSCPVRELGENEEWGYADKNKPASGQ